MMQSSPPAKPPLTKHVDIYMNERLWIGRGFSSKGLFPTERGPFSTEDGSYSWKTLREACLALLRGDVGKQARGHTDRSTRFQRGWSYHEQGGDSNDKSKDDEYECRKGAVVTDEELEYCGFVPCTSAEDGPTDEEGWSYYADFSPQSLLTPTRNRGMLDFVRRRKLRRVAYFRPDHFLPKDLYSKCNFCDSKAVNMISQTMLDVLALASLYSAGTASIDCTDAKVLPLKSKLIDFLNFGNNCEHDVLLYDDNSHYNTMSDVYKIKDKLSTFAESTVGGPGALVHLFHPDVGDSMVKAMPRRKELISTRYFPERERVAYAKLIVKDLDRHAYQLHCNKESCAGNTMGEEHGDNSEVNGCEFRWITCRNPNCSETYSIKYEQYHDEECGFKLLPCTSGCGMEVPRNEMTAHVRNKCVLRAAECPLACLGCTTIVQAQDVRRHLNESSDQHFLFVANKMMECQAMIKKLNGRIQVLEEKNAQLELELRGRTATNKKDVDTMSIEVKKLVKRIGALEGSCRAEFRKLEQDRKKINNK